MSDTLIVEILPSFTSLNLAMIVSITKFKDCLFKVMDELQRLDFTNNKNWYKHKLIANVNCCKDFKYIKDRIGGRFYEDKIKQLQTALNMELPGVLHLGRKIAVCIMEILQIPLE